MLLLFTFLFVRLTLSTKSVVLERPDAQPINDWEALYPTNPNKKVTVIFAVKQQNKDKLISKLFAVSDPQSPDYGNFLTTKQVQNLVKPNIKSFHLIKKWLKVAIKHHKIKFEKNNGDLISFKISIKKLNKLLNTTYFDYKNKKNGDIVSRIKFGLDYYVPKVMKKHLDFIEPTHRFPIYSTLKKSNGAGQVTPTELHALYNTGSTLGVSKKNIVGVASFRDQYYSMEDLQTIWKDYGIESTNVTNVPANQPSGYHLECELDTQYMSSMAQKVPMEPWYTGGINFPNALMEWSKDVLNAAEPPLLFSVSYGTTEAYFGADFIDRYNTELAQMGTAGISVFFASGDSGAGGGCTGTGPFQPDYPASSPYVTAVGGVTGGEAGKMPTGETVWVDGGGGFSNYAPIQNYQKTAVENYLSSCSSTLPPQKDFNATGRAYPDISSQSVDFVIIVNGKKEGVSGTSCASPTAGGVFGLINDMRLQKGMKQLGFANPFIYQTAAANNNAFNDVTEGYNKGCGVNKGFQACKGFDAASGFGSPDYTQIVAAALKTGKKTMKWVK